MRSLLVFLTLSTLAPAQNAPHIRDWRPDPAESRLHPKTPCAALNSLTGFNLSVMLTESTPDSCRALILVQPEIRIEVALPANWNRRLYMFGNGGYAGENLAAPNRVAHRNAALALGFAVAQTNTGHDAAREPLATFTLTPQKFLDYAFRSLHVTAETAKGIAEAYYGTRPQRSYYNGCSTGGRQGLILAQRYPDDFDGIIVGAPALNNTANRLKAIAHYQAITKAPIITKLHLLADRVYNKCDALDGLKDGLITDPRQCDFDPDRDLPACSGQERADCFTPPQTATIRAIYSDLVLNGKRVFPGWPKGGEVFGPNGRSGWDGWITRETGLSQSATYADTALKYMLFPKPDPNYDMMRFNLERDAHLLDEIGKIMNATDPDLTRFRDRGGKLLMYFGWADPALNPFMGIEYYEDVTRTMGANTKDFFKLYLLPGVFHCSGGVGPACFDPLAQVIPWVEQGKAPGPIVAQQVEAGKVQRARPLCPYPQVAKYNGQGNPNEAQSFQCR